MCSLSSCIICLLLGSHFFTALGQHETLVCSLCHQSYKCKPKAWFKCRTPLAKKDIRIHSN